MLTWLKLIITYLPLIIQAVVAIEQSLAGAPGATKKQLIMDAIQAGAKVGATVPQAEVAGVSGLVDTVVGTLNTTGFFTHSAAK